MVRNSLSEKSGLIAAMSREKRPYARGQSPRARPFAGAGCAWVRDPTPTACYWRQRVGGNEGGPDGPMNLAGDMRGRFRAQKPPRVFAQLSDSSKATCSWSDAWPTVGSPRPSTMTRPRQRGEGTSSPTVGRYARCFHGERSDTMGSDVLSKSRRTEMSNAKRATRRSRPEGSAYIPCRACKPQEANNNAAVPLRPIRSQKEWELTVRLSLAIDSRKEHYATSWSGQCTSTF